MPERAAKSALLSLSDKRGASELGAALVENDFTIYSTGGTRAELEKAGIEAADVEAITGFPPLFGGRVKTLHPRVFGGILGDHSSDEDQREAREYGIPFFSVVAVNLYPFEATIAKAGATLREAIDQIDIGGVALLRAAAKNFTDVTVLSDPSQYQTFLSALPEGPDLETRHRLAIAAFERTAEYDATIAHYLSGRGEVLPSELPGALELTLPLAQRLRYGENPWSRAAFYLARSQHLPEQLWGKALSYNNLLDLDATLRLLSRAPAGVQIEMPPERLARAAVVKHTVPCGVAERVSVADAVREALGADAISAYGGILAVDEPLNREAAAEAAKFFLEIVAAPEFDAEALTVLRKKKNLRLMRYGRALPSILQQELHVRSALGGVLAEEADPHSGAEHWRVVSRVHPTDQQWQDLAFAWDVVRHVKSNGVVVVRNGVTRGICAGQTNRVSAIRIAAGRAGEGSKGAACASDGFFPFADGLEEAVRAGCAAVIAPEGSIRDEEVIAAADRGGIALVFSNRRYFLH